MASSPLYALRTSEVLSALETSADGLTPEEAQTRLATSGRNSITEPPGIPLYRKLIGHATHLMALLLWSADLQRRNEQVLASLPDLYPRLDAAFAAEGFRPGAFRSFGDALASPPPEPLRLEDLAASPLADLLRPFVFELDGRVAVVTYLRGLRPKNRLIGAFGSFGWGSGGVKDVYAKAKEIGLDIHEPGMDVNYKPSADDEVACYEFGRQFATKLKEYHAQFKS